MFQLPRLSGALPLSLYCETDLRLRLVPVPVTDGQGYHDA